jgi:hypothetical protein
MKIVSNAFASEPSNPLVSPAIHGWTDSTTEKTFTIECVWDSATAIQDDEVWMELFYPENSSNGLGELARDRMASVIASPADQATSTVAWTTTGITNVSQFKLSVTVTPGAAGPITARVHLAKASTTIYVDPMIVES